MNTAIAREYIVSRIGDTPSVATIFGGAVNIFAGRAPRNFTADHITVESGGMSVDAYALGAPRMKSEPLMTVCFWTCVPSDSTYTAAFVAAVKAADGLLDFYGSPQTFSMGTVDSCRRESSMELEEEIGESGEKWVRIIYVYRFCVEETTPA